MLPQSVCETHLVGAMLVETVLAPAPLAYVDGILRILAHQINEKTKKPVSVLGLDDKTAGHHKKVDNLPPNELKIIERVKIIIKKK